MDASYLQSLHTLTADYQVLYQKLRAYHWMVTGPLFFGLHEQFEGLYIETAEKVDELAERLVAAGSRPPLTLAEATSATRLNEASLPAGAEEMVASIVSDYEKLDGWLGEVADGAEAAGDTTTFNLVDGFRDGQKKTAWMLRAFLGGPAPVRV